MNMSVTEALDRLASVESAIFASSDVSAMGYLKVYRQYLIDLLSGKGVSDEELQTCLRKIFDPAAMAFVMDAYAVWDQISTSVHVMDYRDKKALASIVKEQAFKLDLELRGGLAFPGFGFALSERVFVEHFRLASQAVKAMQRFEVIASGYSSSQHLAKMIELHKSVTDGKTSSTLSVEEVAKILEVWGGS